MGKTRIGLSENLTAAIAYSLPPIGWLSGIIMLVIEQENKYVRFHAMQSLILSCAFGIATTFLSVIPFIGGMLASVFGIFVFVSWIVLLVNAIDNKYFKYPLVGEIIYNKIVG